MRVTRVMVRLSEAQVARLDALAAEAGVSRSHVVRRLLDGEVVAPPAAGLLERDDLLALLEERVRAGSPDRRGPRARDQRRDREIALA